jgi:hypothetical protein
LVPFGNELKHDHPHGNLARVILVSNAKLIANALFEALLALALAGADNSGPPARLPFERFIFALDAEFLRNFRILDHRGCPRGCLCSQSVLNGALTPAFSYSPPPSSLALRRRKKIAVLSNQMAA